MEGRDPTDAGALRALSGDPRLAKLDEQLFSSLSLFRVLGVERNEVLHSRVLAALLDPRRHRGAEAMLRALIGRVLDGGGLDRVLEGRLGEVARASWQGVIVCLEQLFIDVVVEIFSSRGAAVVGIENKIDATEGERQIARYQDALRRTYTGWVAVLVFLTPTGREPSTADPHSPVPAVELGYGAVLDVVEEARRGATSGSREASVLGEVAAHLKEDIVGDAESKALVRELWRAHRKALGLVLSQRPRLSDIREQYVGLLVERFGPDNIEVDYFPGRGELREIKMRLPRWFERGFPFTFMLHAKELGRPRVRVLIWREDYTAHAESLRKWAARVNASAGPLVDEDFTPIGSWGWHRIFREGEHPESAVVDEMVFDEGTAVAAVEAVSALVETLRQHVGGT
jgi:hypothetical protein